MRIDILLFDGFDELDAIAPFEVLRAAAAAGAPFQTRLLTLSPHMEVEAANGLRVRPDGALALLGPDERPEVLVVPGGGWNARKPRGARAEAARGDVPAELKRLHASGTTLAGVCTGGMLIATAGLLDGRPAVTHHLALADLREKGANIVDARVVDDGEIVTAGGVTSGLDLALWLVERFAGHEIAHHVESQLEYERRGIVWRADGHADYRSGGVRP
jgi:transcriptional regulator GlxA family with amidase domain